MDFDERKILAVVIWLTAAFIMADAKYDLTPHRPAYEPELRLVECVTDWEGGFDMGGGSAVSRRFEALEARVSKLEDKVFDLEEAKKKPSKGKKTEGGS